MKSARIDAFFSCSFLESDHSLNNYFIAICNALDIKCINVDIAYKETPAEVARKQIEDAPGLIAVATKRKALQNGEYDMPTSVQEELAMAYGQKLPILFFVEEGVSVDGMKGNFGTYHEFKRDEIHDPKFIERVVRSIHNFKLSIISPHDLIYEHDSPEFIAESVQQLIELRPTEGSFCWSYSTTKRINFLSTFKKHIPVTFWATVPTKTPINSKLVHAEFSLDQHSRNLSLSIETIKETPDCSKSLLKITPPPEKGDFIQYSVHAESQYFNPIFFDDIKENKPVELNGIKYHCMDGIIPIQITKNATLELRFPREFKIKKENIVFFVGSYTDDIDYIAESEINRATVSISDYAGNLMLRMEIESPLLRHMYGFAWNPPFSIDSQGSAEMSNST